MVVVIKFVVLVVVVDVVFFVLLDDCVVLSVYVCEDLFFGIDGFGVVVDLVYVWVWRMVGVDVLFRICLMVSGVMCLELLILVMVLDWDGMGVLVFMIWMGVVFVIVILLFVIIVLFVNMVVVGGSFCGLMSCLLVMIYLKFWWCSLWLYRVVCYCGFGCC